MVNFVVEPFDQFLVHCDCPLEFSNKSHPFDAAICNFSENRVVELVSAIEEKILICSKRFGKN